MGITKNRYSVECDNCGAQLSSFTFSSVGEAERRARTESWNIDGESNVTCKRCKTDPYNDGVVLRLDDRGTRRYFVKARGRWHEAPTEEDGMSWLELRGQFATYFGSCKTAKEWSND